MTVFAVFESFSMSDFFRLWVGGGGSGGVVPLINAKYQQGKAYPRE